MRTTHHLYRKVTISLVLEYSLRSGRAMSRQPELIPTSLFGFWVCRLWSTNQYSPLSQLFISSLHFASLSIYLSQKEEYPGRFCWNSKYIWRFQTFCHSVRGSLSTPKLKLDWLALSAALLEVPFVLLEQGFCFGISSRWLSGRRELWYSAFRSNLWQTSGFLTMNRFFEEIMFSKID